MKKFFALLLSAVLVFALVPSFAMAEDEVIFTLSTAEEVNPGDEVTLTLELSGADYEAHGMNLQINYDDAALDVTNVTTGPALIPAQYGGLAPNDALIICDYTTFSNSIRVGALCPTVGLSAHAVALNITFAVAEDVTEDQVIELNLREFFNLPINGENTPIATVTVNGGINIAGDNDTTPEPTEELTPEPTLEPTPEPTEESTPEPTEEPVEDAVVFTMGSAKGVVGGSEVTLDFSINGEYEAHILNAWLDYDASVLTVVKAELGSVLADSGEVTIVDYETVPGSIRLGVVNPESAFSGEGSLLRVTFKVAEKFTEATNIIVRIKQFDILPIGEDISTPIAYKTVNGTISPMSINPPETGAVSLIGLGVIAVATGAGVVIFRKKED